VTSKRHDAIADRIIASDVLDLAWFSRKSSWKPGRPRNCRQVCF